MTYELAKQLKDAGFEQLGDGFALILHKPLPESDQIIDRISWRDFVRIARYENSPEFIYEPTLSELIEACGDEFRSIVFENTDLADWFAVGNKEFKSEVIVFKEFGKTPEEAVAKLWIKLKQ